MKYNFDCIIDRKDTDSIKYEAARRGMPVDVIPMWVADMDYKSPPFVIEALKERSEHGIFGYTEPGEKYIETLAGWFNRRFSWEFDSRWLVYTPGVVCAISTAIRALTQKGDSILIQEPVYYPFRHSVKLNERKLCVNSLIYDDGVYQIDFDDFEMQIRDNSVKMFILCSPHNPVGRVWQEHELRRMGEICLKHNVLIVSDEIHADFVYKPNKHIVFPGLDSKFEDNTILCTSPSKTFNLAGLQLSNIFIPNAEIRKSFIDELSRCGYDQVSIMGMTACKAAYENGDEWLDELVVYLMGNMEFAQSYLSKKLSEVKVVKPEGTYLLWLDFNNLGLSDKELNDLIINKAGLWLDAGTMFGISGSGFQRVNMACPVNTVKTALDRLQSAIKG